MIDWLPESSTNRLPPIARQKWEMSLGEPVKPKVFEKVSGGQSHIGEDLSKIKNRDLYQNWYIKSYKSWWAYYKKVYFIHKYWIFGYIECKDNSGANETFLKYILCTKIVLTFTILDAENVNNRALPYLPQILGLLHKHYGTASWVLMDFVYI